MSENRRPLPPEGTPERRELDAYVDATVAALDAPGGAEILDRMAEGQMPVADGLVSLLLLSGRYERR